MIGWINFQASYLLNVIFVYALVKLEMFSIYINLFIYVCTGIYVNMHLYVIKIF